MQSLLAATAAAGGGDIATQRQRLSDHAYFLVVKTMVITDVVDMAMLAKLRRELGIPDEQHRGWLRELVGQKRSNTLHASEPSTSGAALAMGGGFGGGGGGLTPVLGDQSAPSSSAAAPPAAKGPKPKPASKPDKPGKLKNMKVLAAASGPPPSQLPEFIGRKVKRFWPQDNAWFDGVVTDHKTTSGDYCVTYFLGTSGEQYEWLNMALLASEGSLEVLGDLVDLRSYPKSRAVQASSVLRRFGNNSGGGKKKPAGNGGVGRSGRKRSVATMYDGDSDDMNDLL